MSNDNAGQPPWSPEWLSNPPTATLGESGGEHSKGPAAWWKRASNGMKAAVVGGTVVAFVAGMALLGLLLSTIFGGPEELSDREYARGLCRDVVKPIKRDLDKTWDDVWESDARSVAYEGEAEVNVSEREVVRFKADVISGLRLFDTLYSAVGEYNDDFVLRGSSGEDFRDDLRDEISDAKESIAEVITDVEEVDPADEEDAAVDIVEVVDEGAFFVLDSGNDGSDVATALVETDEDCDLFGYNSGGE